jgi:hypothetical protein
MSDPTPEDIQRLSDEMEELRLAVSDVTMAWAGVENSLSMLLSKLLLMDGNHDLGFAIYFAPSSADLRAKIVSTAFEYAQLAASLDETKLRACFDKAMEKFHIVKKKRNDITHGCIATLETPIKGGTKTGIRLIGPFFHPKTRDSLHSAWGSLAGLTGKQVREAAEAMKEARKPFDEIANLIEEGRDLRAAKGEAQTHEARQEWSQSLSALTERLSRLAESLKIEGPQPSGQIPP